jgi:hypothetical protein
MRMFDDGPVVVCYGPCISCGRTFGYDPDRVPSVPYCHAVSNALDLALEELAALHREEPGQDGHYPSCLVSADDPDGCSCARQQRNHAGPEKDCEVCLAVRGVLGGMATREPVCPACCKLANVQRAQDGLELWPTVDTADPRTRP